MKSNLTIPVFIIATAIATAGGVAFAQQSTVTENDAVADLAKAKISLGQAVSTAESHAGGKATKAELDGGRGGIAFEVEVVTPERKVFDVKVDAVAGTVVSSQADKADRGGKEAEDD